MFAPVCDWFLCLVLSMYHAQTDLSSFFFLKLFLLAILVVVIPFLQSLKLSHLLSSMYCLICFVFLCNIVHLIGLLFRC